MQLHEVSPKKNTEQCQTQLIPLDTPPRKNNKSINNLTVRTRKYQDLNGFDIAQKETEQ